MQSVGRLATVSAICDVDERSLADASRLFPAARLYVDYRELLDDPSIDAVTISAPDHQHGPMVLRALQRRKHCFCQKPLGLTVGEVRRIAEATNSSELATQMALQGITHARARRAIEVLRSGILGEVSEIYAWTDRPGPHWPTDLQPRFDGPSPAGLHWNEWLGATAYRRYHPAYHPRGWRGWIGLGTGALGDMGVHIAALAFAALDLAMPTLVTGSWAAVMNEQFPAWSKLDLLLRGGNSTHGVVMHWYDGGQLPPRWLVDDIRMDDNGCVIVGTEGRCYLPGSMNQYMYLLPRRAFPTFVLPELQPTLDVYEEWLLACVDRRLTTCGFAGISATITEAMLVANLALQVGRRIEWDSDLGEVPGVPDAGRFIHREYREW